MTIDITNPLLERYLFSLVEKGEPIIETMEAEARKRGFPIVDRLVGRLLYVLARLKQPSLVVELGSGFGYSAYWFLLAMDKGTVVLTDRSAENLSSARGYLKDVGIGKKVTFSQGEAVEIAKKYKNIDILFIDIDKKNYRPAIEALENNLSPGALVVADNTLWYGRVAEPDPGEDTRGIMDFNRYIFESPQFFSSLVPLRDGVLIALKS